MPDQFKEVSKTGYGKRIGQSIGGILIGIVLFTASFVLLFWNEGRYDLSLMAKDAVEISATEANTDSSLENKLVSVSGKLTTQENINDGLFLQAGNYLTVSRKVEMYSWIEETDAETKTNLGGSETTETTYTYVKGWDENPEDSSNFKHPEGHINPDKAVESLNKKANSAKVGIYNLNFSDLSLPALTPIGLTENNTILNDSAELAGDYIFVSQDGWSDINAPEIGDLKISYSVLHSGIDGTLMGKLESSKISSYGDKDGNSLYRFFTGSKDQGVGTLSSEHGMTTWILRVVGFLMMWIGLGLVLAPLSVLLDVLPFLGKASRFMVGIATFAVALVLSAVTIIVSKIVHNVIALVVVLVVVVGIIVYLVVKAKKKAPKKPAEPQAPAPPPA